MARYQEAIDWIAANDDTEWVNHAEDWALGTESVTAALVADLFGKESSQVRKDLVRALKRIKADSALNPK